MGILQAQNVHYIYQSKYQKVHAVKGINFDFEDGKFTDTDGDGVCDYLGAAASHHTGHHGRGHGAGRCRG